MWRTDESGKEEGSYRATFRTSAQCIGLPLRRPTKDVVGKKYDQRKQMNAQMPNANGYEQHYYVAGNAQPHHSALLLLSSSCLLLSLPRTDVQLQLVKLHLRFRLACGVATPTTCRVSSRRNLLLSFCRKSSWHPVTWKITNMSERLAEVAQRRLR